MTINSLFIGIYDDFDILRYLILSLIVWITFKIERILKKEKQ